MLVSVCDFSCCVFGCFRLFWFVLLLLDVWVLAGLGALVVCFVCLGWFAVCFLWLLCLGA